MTTSLIGAARTELNVTELAVERSHGRIAAIDGMRGVAVSGVVAFHVFGSPVGGYLGVDFFFVISGFVITLVLLDERSRNGRISFQGFWLRRARRLLPGLAVLLIALAVWTRLAETSRGFLKTSSEQTLSALTYATNWWQIFGPTGYWDLGSDQSPLTHLWSLAVEEQFYLAWPILFVIIRKAPLRWCAGIAALLAAASYSWSLLLANSTARHLDAGLADRIYQGTDTRSGALLLGCAAAFWLRGRQTDGRPERQRRGWPVLLITTTVIALAVTWTAVASSDVFLYRGCLIITGLSAMVLLYQAGANRLGAWQPVFANRPLLFLGAISYPLYLWHWPVWLIANRELPGLSAEQIGLLTIGLSVLAAWATHRLVELPIQARRPRWRLVLPVVLIVSGALAANAIHELHNLPKEHTTGVVVTG